MNTLNLIRLNLQSPYEVWTESNDTYFFETDYGVKYMIQKESIGQRANITGCHSSGARLHTSITAISYEVDFLTERQDSFLLSFKVGGTVHLLM